MPVRARSAQSPSSHEPRCVLQKAEELMASIQTIVVHNTMDVAALDAHVRGSAGALARCFLQPLTHLPSPSCQLVNSAGVSARSCQVLPPGVLAVAV